MGFEQDILHFVTCRMHDPTLGEFLQRVQRKEIAVVLLGLCLIVVAIRDARVALRTLLVAGVGWGLGMGVAGLLWVTVDRTRPQYVMELRESPADVASCAGAPRSMVMHGHGSKRPSFPSRHGVTAGLFAMALLLAWWPLGVLAWPYALLVGLARLYFNKHWPTDVVAGIVLGAVIGWLLWRWIPRLLGRVGLGDWVHDRRTPEALQS